MPSDVEWYEGGLLGVSADVLLDRRAMKAHITLKGPVFPGAVSGGARFADPSVEPVAGGGGVVIEEPLKGILERRFVSINDARYDPNRDEVVVCVKLPLGLGNHAIKLKRVK